MPKRYVDVGDLDKYLGMRTNAESVASRATYRRIHTCHTIGLARLHRMWQRDKEHLDKQISKLMRLPEGKEKLIIEARIRKLQERMRRTKEKAVLLAAKQGVFLDV